MSCKILSRNERGEAQRIRWRDMSSGPAPEARSHATTSPPAQDTDKLHGRIAELERLLKSEVIQARDRAYQEGAQAGRDAATAELQPVLDRMLRSCAELTGMRAKIRRETETDIITLTIEIARRVIRRELSVDPEAIHGVVKAALEKLQAKEVATICVHPEHLAAVKAYLQKAGIGAGIDIVADPTLQSGGLVFDTKRGKLDASVETQLREIERGFADRLG